MSDQVDPRRRLPSIDQLLTTPEANACVQRWGRAATRDALRSVLEQAREVLGAAGGKSEPASPEPPDDPMAAAVVLLERRSRPGLGRVLNGTGVLLHTNLGRAPLSPRAIDNVVAVGSGYSNLEYDLESGTRGSRDVHCAERICRLTGSDDALVVNNTAAAVALVVNCLSNRRHVVVSRGELVEIGGSFRLPGIVSAAGGILVEVGTTNRTRAADFRAAIGPETGMLLKVHPSNYRIEGFTEEVGLQELAEIGGAAGVPVVYDLGSGWLAEDSVPRLPAEPTPRGSVQAGADLVLWSGDKLLGGPQAGIIHGGSEWIDRLRRSPLLRALRVDKLTLAALEATLILHEDPQRAVAAIPTMTALAESADSVRRRAEATVDSVTAAVRNRIQVVELRSLVGGGTFPGLELASAGWLLEAPPMRIDGLLRASTPPLIGRIEDDRLVIDFRTLAQGDEEIATAASVSTALAQISDGEVER